MKKMTKDRLQNYLIFCFQNTQSFKGFWKQFRSSCFVTIPKQVFGIFIILTMALTAIPASAEFSTRDLNNEQIMALSWVQNSAEFKALAHQAFNLAKLRWDMDKKGGKKCVIVDVDETIIDNSAFNAGLIGKDYGYGNSTWKEFCFDESSLAIPGAVAFLNHVADTGGDIFYLTNRKAMPEKNIDLTQATMKNLKALGFPQIDKKHMLLRTGTSKKQPRRDSVTQMGYRAVLLMGDNLADFDEAFDGDTMDVRDKAVEDNKDKFGDIFIVLPNPVYGNWEGAVYGGGKWYKKTAKEKSELRINTLRRFKFSK
ncbi:MAG: 5'-nucleotidase, lipoprotein e(P4) family [Desulfobacteraceae bacterium]|nr:5'-nucleotidase, lipoprotein e(P4) family [Desulfobacteraceae bacterium]